MRRARLVKKRGISAFLFCAAFSWAGIGMGLDVKSGLIAKDFSSFTQAKLNTMFSGKVMKLGRIETSGFKNLAITDFSVCRKTDSSPMLSVDKIIIDYDLINLALRRFENLGKIYLISPSLYLSDRRDILVPPIGGVGKPRLSEYLSGTSAYTGKPLKFQILNGNITVLGRAPILKNLEGQVSFYNAALELRKVKGNFLDIPVIVTGHVENILERPAIKLRITAKDKYYSVSCTFKNSVGSGEGRIWGSARIFDKFQTRFKGVVSMASGQTVEIKKLVLTNPFMPKNSFSVTGSINLSDGSSKLVIEPNAGAIAGDADLALPGYIKITAAADKDKGLSVNARISHWNFLGHDVLSEVEINSGLYKTGDSRKTLKGYLKTRNFILDYKPFKEVALNWIVKDKELFITDFQLGDRYRVSGKIKLFKPYQTDLELTVNNADVNEWFLFAGPSYPVSISGLISGRIKVEGPIAAMSTNGRLNMREGNINEIKFNAINFNLKGKGPILTISDSRIFKDGGFLRMDGEIDLRKFGKRNMLEDMKITTDQKVIVWEGWDITKSPSEIMGKKGVSDNVDVNFKTYVTAGTQGKSGMDNDDNKKSEIGLDYKIKKDDSINVRMKEDSAFVGVEHKMKF